MGNRVPRKEAGCHGVLGPGPSGRDPFPPRGRVGRPREVEDGVPRVDLPFSSSWRWRGEPHGCGSWRERLFPCLPFFPFCRWGGRRTRGPSVFLLSLTPLFPGRLGPGGSPLRGSPWLFLSVRPIGGPRRPEDSLAWRTLCILYESLSILPDMTCDPALFGSFFSFFDPRPCGARPLVRRIPVKRVTVYPASHVTRESVSGRKKGWPPTSLRRVFRPFWADLFRLFFVHFCLSPVLGFVLCSLHWLTLCVLYWSLSIHAHGQNRRGSPFRLGGVKHFRAYGAKFSETPPKWAKYPKKSKKIRKIHAKIAKKRRVSVIFTLKPIFFGFRVGVPLPLSALMSLSILPDMTCRPLSGLGVPPVFSGDPRPCRRRSWYTLTEKEEASPPSIRGKPGD